MLHDILPKALDIFKQLGVNLHDGHWKRFLLAEHPTLEEECLTF
jgi:hypothetical protein